MTDQSAAYTQARLIAIQNIGSALERAEKGIHDFRDSVIATNNLLHLMATSESVFTYAAQKEVASQILKTLMVQSLPDSAVADRIISERDSATMSMFGSSSTSVTRNLASKAEAEAWYKLSPSVLALFGK